MAAKSVEVPDAVCIDVLKDGEWGTFFYRERIVLRDGKEPRHSATWCCYSSFGTFGHSWYDMGEPLAAFIAGMDDDYLLSKISKKVTSGDKAIDHVRRLILEQRREGDISKDVAREAYEAVTDIECDGHSPEGTCEQLYASREIEKINIDWCDLNCQEWDNSAVMFVRKVWPSFVATVTGTTPPDNQTKDVM